VMLDRLPSRALSHPLPAGMRDLLPHEARKRRSLARRVLEHFGLHGYHLVTPPAFEFAEVLERGLGALDPSDVLRFVEPESGEVAALRPDVTPQIARMVATRLSREPPPIRLCYEGTIVRRRQGRARRERQVPQAGVELYGLGALAGDVEIVDLAAGAVRAAGLEEFVIDVGHASIARSLTAGLPPPLAAAIASALERKDSFEIEARIREATDLPERVGRALLELSELHGGGPGEIAAEALFARAEDLLGDTPARGPLLELRALYSALRARPGLADVLRLDLGVVRGLAYYTGAIFHVLAAGPGEPIAAGGRYDDLLARFDAPMPAVGFAIHLEALDWSRRAQGIADTTAPRLVVASGPGADELAAALRALGVSAVEHDGALARPYAAAWGFSHVGSRGPSGGFRVESTVPDAHTPVDLGDDPVQAARTFVSSLASQSEDR
jgi:ATP phosphoribosyltransferase regulatory subunit